MKANLFGDKDSQHLIANIAEMTSSENFNGDCAETDKKTSCNSSSEAKEKQLQRYVIISYLETALIYLNKDNFSEKASLILSNIDRASVEMRKLIHDFKL